jgi:hypothetical protein
VGEIGEMGEEEVVDVSLRQFQKAEGPIYVTVFIRKTLFFLFVLFCTFSYFFAKK